MVDVLEGSGMARLEDPTGIESALWNASLTGCKEGLQALCSSNDDGNDRGQERQRDAHMSNHRSISGVDCGEALGDLDSNLAKCSEQGDEDLQANREGNMKVELVDYEVDPYEEALWMYNLPDGGGETFFCSEIHNQDPTSRTTRCASFSLAYIIFGHFFSSGQFSFLLICLFP
jgi:hypothetical protein